MVHKSIPQGRSVVPFNVLNIALQKGWLLIAFVLFVFVGQASAQSVSLKHNPDAGGIPYRVSGQGTPIIVEVSITGVSNPVNAYQVVFEFDASLLTLSAPGFLVSDQTATLLSLSPAVPSSHTFTFTTRVDVSGREFSIGVSSVALDGVSVSASDVIYFNLPHLYLDTEIESPAENNDALTFAEKRSGDTIAFQLFAPDLAGQQFNAAQLELALQGKTASNYIGSSSSDWSSTVSGNTLNLSSASSVTVSSSGYLGQIDLQVTRALASGETLLVQSASLDNQKLDVYGAVLSFVRAYCPGDFDDNGMINVPDFLLFVGVFGTSAGDANYNARMDMDGNGMVGVPDFLLFVKVFGTTCETTSLPPPPPPPPTSNFDIPDRNLRAVIEDSLGKASGAPITQAEMATLTRLEAPNKNIRDLTGLEFATGLTRLVLGLVYVSGEGRVNSNDISDLSPLSGLTNLRTLSLSGNSISDVSALSNLTNLTVLDLNDNSISNVSPLSGLTNLRTLLLSDNSISDVSALSALTNLTGTLALGDNSISDVSALSNLTNVAELWLNDNSISDVSALSNLANLRDLYLYDNSISDLAPLVSNTGLGSGDDVDVQNNPLSNTSINIHIPALQGRGVRVSFTSPTSTPTSPFDLDDGNDNPTGITYANNRFYVLDSVADKVYAYTSSGQREAGADFDLDDGNDNPTGITYANNRFYVLDSVADKVYAYTSSGQREAGADFDLDDGNSEPAGITYANNRFYVGGALSGRDDKVYAYTSSGQQETSADFDLDDDNSSPAGITYANNRFYVVDTWDDKVYVYTGSEQ